MRYIIPALLALCILLGAAGCGRKTTQKFEVTEMKEEKSPSGDVTKDTWKVKSEDGRESTITTEFRTVTDKELGLPIYPGAKQNDDFSTGSDNMGAVVLMVGFTTDDSFEKVMEFYRENLDGFKESKEKTIEGSRFSGFRKISGKDSAGIVIESPPGKPTSISMTVQKASKK